jgi:hypothetical protein
MAGGALIVGGAVYFSCKPEAALHLRTNRGKSDHRLARAMRPQVAFF